MKKILFGVLPVLAILVAGVVVYSFLFRPQPEAPTWVVSTYTGSVEVSLAAGPWVTAEMRQGLTDGDRLRTGPASGLTLVHGESHVEIKESTQIEVTQLNADQSKFELAQGQVFVEARGNQVGMRSQAGAAMDTKDAGVGMTVRPDGWTQVQVKRGEVNFTANDRTERVAVGARLQGRGTWLTVESARPAGSRWLVHFAGIADRTAAEAYVNTQLLAEPLPALSEDGIRLYPQSSGNHATGATTIRRS